MTLTGNDKRLERISWAGMVDDLILNLKRLNLINVLELFSNSNLKQQFQFNICTKMENKQQCGRFLNLCI